ncbi:hypothetical protein SOK09_32020, partial [Pseudomonas aeruginosa]|uniref:hypothetical protein n=6 Tax=Pseudomonas aeruginosa TaxID=287 RepID=UPI002A69BAFB
APPFGGVCAFWRVEMSSFTASRVVDIDGVELTVRELSVADVRKLMQEVSDQDLVNNVLFEDIRLSDLCLMTSVTKSQINDLRPSQLAKLRDACKEVNPHFFGMLGRLSKLPDKP